MNRNFGVMCVVVEVIVINITFQEAILADSRIDIVSLPSSIIAGQEFEVSFSANGLDPNGNYNVKGLGGVNFTEVDTWNSEWLQQNAAWISMPSFFSGDSGSPSASFRVRFDNKAEAGAKDFKIRAKKMDSNDTSIDSQISSITVLANTPSPTPTSTPTHLATPYLTLSPIPTVSLKPMLYTPKPVVIVELSDRVDTKQSSSPEVLSATSSIQADTKVLGPKTELESKPPLIAFISVGLGIIFIGLSGFLAFIKFRKNTSDPESLIQ